MQPFDCMDNKQPNDCMSTARTERGRLLRLGQDRPMTRVPGRLGRPAPCAPERNVPTGHAHTGTHRVTATLPTCQRTTHWPLRVMGLTPAGPPSPRRHCLTRQLAMPLAAVPPIGPASATP